MSDIDDVRALFTRLGIGFFEGTIEMIGERSITFEAKQHKRVEGYSSFYAIFHFEDDGKFTSVSLGE